MSQLSVFRPSDVTDGGPRILSFATYAARIKSDQLFDVVSRAKLTHDNCSCPDCGRATVETVKLGPALINHRGHRIPHSAPIGGFSCRACGHSWPA
jgi:hypothetical protein